MRSLVIVLLCSLGSPLVARDTVPFRATIDTQVAQVGFCGPTCVMLSISGTGEGLHFGRVATDGPSQIDFATLAQTGTATLTAADGSSIDISFSGTFVPGSAPGDATFSGRWSVISGTGRFDDASGGGDYSGSASGDAGVLHLDGRLSNPGRR